MITKEQELSWREHIVTKKLYSELENIKQVFLDRIGNSSRSYSQTNMAIEMARDAGVIEALNIITTAQFADEEAR
jgi:hypothetical protein